MKLPLWARDEVLYQYGFIELYWLYREWSNIITWRAVSIKTDRSNILSRLEVTVKWDAWTVFKYLLILFQNGRTTDRKTVLNVEVPAYKYAAPKKLEYFKKHFYQLINWSNQLIRSFKKCKKKYHTVISLSFLPFIKTTKKNI